MILQSSVFSPRIFTRITFSIIVFIFFTFYMRLLFFIAKFWFKQQKTIRELDKINTEKARI